MELYKVKITNLGIQNQNNEKEIKEMKNYIKYLEELNMNLESDYSLLQKKYNLIISKGSDLKELRNMLDNKNEEILQLKEAIQNLKIKHEQYISKIDIQYEKDVNQVKYFNESNEIKIENATKVVKLNELMYQKILQLENIIKTFEEEEKKRMLIKEVEFEKKMDETKKKMLNLIKNGKEEIQLDRTNNGILKEKLNILNQKGLMNELEYQSFQIEDLLKQRDHLDKILLGYKNDVKIHSEIEKKLIKKNKKYTDIIKVLSNKNDISKINLKLNFNEESRNSIKINQNFGLDFYNKKNKLNNSPINHSIYDSKSISSQKEILYYQKELENYRNKYKTLQDRLDSIYNQYSNLINILNETLEKIYNDNNFSTIKELYVNVDDFKTCDFEKLNPEQKYLIIIIVIKNLLPILNLDKIYNLETKFNKIKNKFNNDNFILFPIKKISKGIISQRYDSFKDSLKKSYNNSNFNAVNLSASTNCLTKSYLKKKNPILKKSYSLLKIS